MQIETARLILRPFAEADGEAALAWLGDPVAMRYIEPPFGLEQAKSFVTSCAERVGCLCLKESGLPIGHVIWHPYMGDSARYELGWILSRAHWGRGYAKEISLALIQWAKGQGIEEIILEAAPENGGSIALIEHLGALYSHSEEGLRVYTVKI